MIKAEITHDESIKVNLETWCYEVGSTFEKMGQAAAEDFVKFITVDSVLELGAGDGAANKVFEERNLRVVSVDINMEKLLKIRYGLSVQKDMLELLQILPEKTVPNIFTHHSLEHVVEAEQVLEEVSRVMEPLGIFYAVVPAGDYLHSVHHVVFESPDELLPKGFKPIVLEEQKRNEPEFICVAQKLV